MFEHIPLTLAQQEIDGKLDQGTREGANFTTSETGTAIEQGPVGTNPTGQVSSPFGGGLFIPMILILVVFWFFMMGGQRREKKKRAAMLAALKKGDKVQTAGGILGTVVEVRPSDVLVKVDENANTRIKFARSSIQNILQDKDED